MCVALAKSGKSILPAVLAHQQQEGLKKLKKLFAEKKSASFAL